MKLTKVEKQFLLDPQRSGEYHIYLEKESDSILHTNGISSFANPSSMSNPVFRIEFEDETRYIAQHHLPDTTILNFRDIGGFTSEDGRQVKYNTFYRCAPVAPTTSDGLQYVQNLQMKTVMDFRSEQEALGVPDIELAGCENIRIGAIVGNEQAFSGSFDFEALIKQAKTEDLKAYMCKTYENLPFDNPAYKKMFEQLFAKQVPLAFHCSAGKDRTGVAAYLILRTLGVDETTIMEDYLASNQYRQAENERMKKLAGPYGDVVMELMMVCPEYLQMSIDSIHQRYPNFFAYIEAEYGIDEQKVTWLREQYLY